MIKNDIFFSIVVPVYNIEKYLDRCIHSIVCQSYSNFEVILVDDGATDSCSHKCDEWCLKDSRLRCIHKKNEGLGFARNSGMDCSRGDFIIFIDGDDYVSFDMLEKIASAINKFKCDIYLYGFFKVGSSGKITSVHCPYLKKNIYEGKEIQDYILPNLFFPRDNQGHRTNLMGSSCLCAYSLNFIRKNSWKFVSEREIVLEDVFSLLCLYSFVNSVGIISEALYFYCNNPGSLSHSSRYDKFYEFNNFYINSIKTCTRLNYNDYVKQSMFYSYFSAIVGYLKNICTSKEKLLIKLRVIKKMLQNDSLQSIFDESNINMGMESFGRKRLIKAIKSKNAFCVLLLVFFSVIKSRL